MRFITTVATMLISLAAAHTSAQETTTRGGHTIGDCLKPIRITSCKSHLERRTEVEGIDYLKESGCPNCIWTQVATTQGPFPQPVLRWECPGGEWADLIDANENTPNPLYDTPPEDELGATLVGFEERVCRVSGTCTKGKCDFSYSEQIDPVTLQRVGTPICPSPAGGSVLYVVKIFDETCEMNMTVEMMNDMEADMAAKNSDHLN